MKNVDAASVSLDQPFWDALQQGRLSLQACGACSRWTWPPQWRCGACGGWNMVWRELEPTGVVHSMTATHHPFTQEMQGLTPLLTLLVELPQADGIRLLGRASGDGREFAIGDEVTIEFSPQAPGLHWRRVQEATR